MTAVETKIAELETRLHHLNEKAKDNNGVKRKIERELRNLRKQHSQPQN